MAEETSPSAGRASPPDSRAGRRTALVVEALHGRSAVLSGVEVGPARVGRLVLHDRDPVLLRERVVRIAIHPLLAGFRGRDHRMRARACVL